jgi:hypothetical protein
VLHRTQRFTARSHEHRPLRRLLLRWPACWPCAVVVCPVAARLRRRPCPPPTIDIARLVQGLLFLPTFLPTRREKRKKGRSFAGNLFSLLFQIVGSGTHPPSPREGGRVAKRVSLRLPNTTQFPENGTRNTGLGNWQLANGTRNTAITYLLPYISKR